MKKTLIFRVVEERIKYVAVEVDQDDVEEGTTFGCAAEEKIDELLIEGKLEEFTTSIGKTALGLVSETDGTLEKFYEKSKIKECNGVRYCDAN